MLIHITFLTIISINLFCYCREVFTHTNTWVIGKLSQKHHYPKKEDCYSNLNADADYRHKKRVRKIFKMKHFGEYHDLYVHSKTFLLADILQNFQNICLKIDTLDHANFFSAPAIIFIIF